MLKGGHKLSWWGKLADLINWSVQGFFLQSRMTMNRTISWTVFWKAPERWHREPEPDLAFSGQSKAANLILITGWTEQWVLCTDFPFQSRPRNLTDLSLCSFFTVRETLMLMSGGVFFNSSLYEARGKSFYFQNTEVKQTACGTRTFSQLHPNLSSFRLWGFLVSCMFRVHLLCLSCACSYLHVSTPGSWKELWNCPFQLTLMNYRG